MNTSHILDNRYNIYGRQLDKEGPSGSYVCCASSSSSAAMDNGVNSSGYRIDDLAPNYGLHKPYYSDQEGGLLFGSFYSNLAESSTTGLVHRPSASGPGSGYDDDDEWMNETKYSDSHLASVVSTGRDPLHGRGATDNGSQERQLCNMDEQPNYDYPSKLAKKETSTGKRTEAAAKTSAAVASSSSASASAGDKSGRRGEDEKFSKKSTAKGGDLEKENSRDSDVSDDDDDMETDEEASSAAGKSTGRSKETEASSKGVPNKIQIYPWMKRAHGSSNNNQNNSNNNNSNGNNNNNGGQ